MTEQFGGLVVEKIEMWNVLIANDFLLLFPHHSFTSEMFYANFGWLWWKKKLMVSACKLGLTWRCVGVVLVEVLLSLHRLDTTLIDFTDMKCQRGDLSFIFNGDAAPSESFVVLDNEQKVYQRIHHEVKLCLNLGCEALKFTKQNVSQKSVTEC